jgi:O-antigen biosynthesis protein WbqP
MFDCKCFFGSVHVFKEDDSVVEGGTGEMKKEKSNEQSINNYTRL